MYNIVDRLYDKVSHAKLVELVQKHYDTKIRLPQEKMIQIERQIVGTETKMHRYAKWARVSIWDHFTVHERSTGLIRWLKVLSNDEIDKEIRKTGVKSINIQTGDVTIHHQKISCLKRLSDFTEGLVKKNAESRSR